MWSKGNDVTTANGEVSYGLPLWCYFYCSNFITVAPLQLEIKKDLSKSCYYEVMASLPPEAECLIEPFEWDLCAV